MKAMKTMGTVMFLAATLWAGTAAAHVPPASTELNWRLGILDYDSGSSELLLGVDVARNLKQGNWGVEGSFGLALGDNFKGYLVHGNGVYNFEVASWEKVVPFLTAGVGIHSFSPDAGDGTTDLAINFGGGAKIFMTERLALRGDVRDNVIFFDNNTTHNLSLSGGLTWFFRSDM